MREYHKNPRNITKAQLTKLKANIEELGDLSGIVHDLNSDEIVSGNQRSKIIDVNNCNIQVVEEYNEPNSQGTVLIGFIDWEGQKLNYRQVRWTPEQCEKANITANSLGGTWDFSIGDWDDNLLADWQVDKEFIVTPKKEVKEDDYVQPDKIKTDIVLGDLFQIGRHRLLCGDSTDKDSFVKLMAGKKADMVFTDPPYNVNYGADTNHPSWNNKRGDRTIKNDKMSTDAYREFVKNVFINIREICDGVIYCFGAQGEDGRILFTELDKLFHNSGTIVWLKDSLVLGRGKSHTKYEPCWFGWNKSGKTFTDDRTLTNVWEVNRPKRSELHPTMKPIKLTELALDHNPKALSVIDPFIGSGGTMVAAEQMGRVCYAMELDPKYCEVTIQRMKHNNPNIEVKKILPVNEVKK